VRSANAKVAKKSPANMWDRQIQSRITSPDTDLILAEQWHGIRLSARLSDRARIILLLQLMRIEADLRLLNKQALDFARERENERGFTHDERKVTPLKWSLARIDGKRF
jgi:hypothetical protein